jgi:HlyD family secretion protein
LKRALIGAGIAVIAGLIVFFSIRGNGNEGEKVYVEPATTRRIDAVVAAPGEVNPKFKVNISSHVIGKIEHLFFNEGDFVKKGQKLIELEKASYVAERNRVASELANRRIEVTRARTQQETAQLAFKRASNLLAQGIQAQELYDKARLDLDNARAAYQSAQQGVEQASSSLIQADTNLSYTTIASPVDGKIVQLNTREGEVAIPGTTNIPGAVLAIVADMSEILVEAQIGETEVVGIRVGEAAKIKVDAVPDKEYSGHVIEIGSSAASTTGAAGSGIRYFKVKVAIDDADDRLRPGMTSQVSIVTTTLPNALAVPIQSVVERVPGAKTEDDENDENLPKKKYVFIVKDSTAKMTEVTTGISDALYVAIAGGLKAGDPVITGPFKTLKKIKDGDRVQVTTEEKNASKKKED